MVGAKWVGGYYYRKRDNTYRNRNTGVVINSAQITKRKNKRNRAKVAKTVKNYQGVEQTNRHYYGGDPNRKRTRLAKSYERKFLVKVNKNRPGSKKPRRKHNRVVKR